MQVPLRWHRRRQTFTRCGPPTARRSPSSVRRVSSNLALTCAQPVARPRRESDACPAASPHAPRPKAVVHPRWNRRLRPRTRRTALRRAPAARVRACRVSGQRKQVNDFGGAAPGAAELTKRSAVSQLHPPASVVPAHTTHFLFRLAIRMSLVRCRARRCQRRRRPVPLGVICSVPALTSIMSSDTRGAAAAYVRTQPRCVSCS